MFDSTDPFSETLLGKGPRAVLDLLETLEKKKYDEDSEDEEFSAQSNLGWIKNAFMKYV